MQTVVCADMQREKANKVFDRRLKENINGPKGLNSQFRLELQRLRRDERLIGSQLQHLNLDMCRIAASSYRNSVKKALSNNATELSSSSFTTPKIIPLQLHRQQSKSRLSIKKHKYISKFEQTELSTNFSLLPSVITSFWNDEQKQHKSKFFLLNEFPQIESFEEGKLLMNRIAMKQQQQQRSAVEINLNLSSIQKKGYHLAKKLQNTKCAVYA
ncbi:unnamed protein product [Didymodactylos carnosus]|uniref:Uncharacterized protein n=1 Tax=Didymodactylos carnosus TaxID=1234261 RepID=A0A813W6J2_9BILA|nr:unnamed protein product [Didymodactylos carnosus]CAF0967244.1 unnamed protein product [Didymodactylos carnosus]CAF3644197.1 unnamed protein product [Didymodactylos carnosus]CAF3738910.1 unnamed protein product [Didymodactylos carnosus]